MEQKNNAMKLLLLNTFMLFLLFACNENIEIATENIIDNFEEYKVLEEELINLEEIDIGTKLNNPWALEFINDNEILITEKSGNLIYANLETNNYNKIIHEIPVASIGQGGLLDIKIHDGYLYVSFSIKNDNDKYTTAIGKGTISDLSLIHI